MKRFMKDVKNMDDAKMVLAALNNYLISVEGKEKQYIAHGSTWFNRWRDWLDEEAY